jgi:hypothetical protein
MKKLLALLLCLLIFIVTNAQVKRRADSFFGIHFDFHATQNDSVIGRSLTAQQIDSFLTLVHPDFVQIDCKGHPGYSSYPTRVGNRAGGFTKDILQLWRERTAKHHVALYVHYSGIMDQKAVTDHKDWARVLPDGSADGEKAAYLGPYLDQLLIPQMKEIADYGVNGAWVDGECWATQPDYSTAVVQKFMAETGIVTVPKSATDTNYHRFIAFNRKIFRSYLRKYIDAIHAYKPSFEITSNWSYSSMMPEPVDAGVDYLSGDVAGQNGVYNAAFQARCLALQGKPWDLMSWGFAFDFSTDGGLKGPKSLVQLEQEAAAVISMGGGYQCYFTQNNDGSIKPWYFSRMAALGEFCRARQAFCKGATSVPQIGLWYSTYSKGNETNQVYGWNVPNVEANLSMLLDGQQSVEILLDHQLKNRISNYPVIVIPEFAGLDTGLKKLVLDYVQQGGHLLVIGAEAVKEFQPQLGIDLLGDTVTGSTYFNFDGEMAAAKTTIQPVHANKNTEAIGDFCSTDDPAFSTGYPIATISNFGKGKIVGVYANLSNVYYKYQSRFYVQLMQTLLTRLMPEPIVKITGSQYVQTAVTRKGGHVYIHLINTAGAHFNQKVYAYDQIPATGELLLQVNTKTAWHAAMLQPEGKALKYSVKNGQTFIRVPSIAVHSIVDLY